MRIPMSQALKKVTRLSGNIRLSQLSTTASTSAPEKVEVFIDGKPVMVDPGTTVLQVINLSKLCL